MEPKRVLLWGQPKKPFGTSFSKNVGQWKVLKTQRWLQSTQFPLWAFPFEENIINGWHFATLGPYITDKTFVTVFECYLSVGTFRMFHPITLKSFNLHFSKWQSWEWEMVSWSRSRGSVVSGWWNLTELWNDVQGCTCLIGRHWWPNC